MDITVVMLDFFNSGACNRAQIFNSKTPNFTHFTKLLKHKPYQMKILVKSFHLSGHKDSKVIESPHFVSQI